MVEPYIYKDEVDLEDRRKFTEFTMIDPFNPENEVSGVYRNDKKGKRTYGLMVITKVNGWKCEQWIPGVPKMGYPYRWDALGNMEWDRRKFRLEVKEAIYMEKVDGTAIIGFKYRDHKGNFYVSYRTRQTPFIIESTTYGSFMQWWKRQLVKYQDMPKLVELVRGSVVFELYGKEHKIGIHYPNEMNARILFRVDMLDGILPSPFFWEDASVDELRYLSIPSMPFFNDELDGTVADNEQSFEKLYWRVLNAMREASWKDEKGIHNHLPIIYAPGDILCEGVVWYVKFEDGSWKPFKCKTELMLEHQGEADKIPRLEITKAINKALTVTSTPKPEDVKPFLLEDYPQYLVDRYDAQIIRLTEDLMKMALVEDLEMEVIELYEQLKADRGLDFLNNQDIGDIMRAMSEKFGKAMSKKIFGVLSRHTGRK